MKKLTVILRNNGPMIYAGDPPTHRSVQIVLTTEQCTAIEPKKIGVSGGANRYEEISQCFIEPESGEFEAAIGEEKEEAESC